MNAERGMLNEKRQRPAPNRSSFIVHRSAFTLVELMISIALMLLLIVGVNLVFKMTGQAVGAGQALSDGVRNANAAQAVFQRDFTNAVVDDEAPCMLLFSYAVPAFRNRADELSDRDYDPTATDAQRRDQILTTDLDGDNIEGERTVPGERISRAVYNHRNHRVDTIAFFARGQFPRQTGNRSTYVADMSAGEAYIHYGHLIVNGSGAFGAGQMPGEGTFLSNPDNFYASQWILGRSLLLLKEPDSSGNIPDSSGTPQDYISGTNSPLSPLAYGSNSTNLNGEGTYIIQQSRYDLAGISMRGFLDKLRPLVASNPNNWHDTLFFRYHANPTVVRPITSASLAKQSPIFLRSCTQFIVEYAGDYIKQNLDSSSTQYGWRQDIYLDPVTGKPKPDGTDGEIDFIVDFDDKDGNGIITNTTELRTASRRVRWYGFPRNIVDVESDKNTVFEGFRPVIRGGNPITPDVVPLRDIAGGQAPFEKTLPPSPSSPTNYAHPGKLKSDSAYVCAWGPDDPKPWMIRVTIVLDDPNGRLGDGQTFEYVFRLK